MRRMFKTLKRMHWLLYVLFGYSITLIISLIFFSIFPEGSNYNPVADKEAMDLGYIRFFYILIIIPIVETTIFQLFPFYLLRWFLSGCCRFYTYIFISASLFAVNHFWSVYYVIFTFVIGIIMAIWFYVGKLRRQNAFLLVSTIHFINNSLVELFF